MNMPGFTAQDSLYRTGRSFYAFGFSDGTIRSGTVFPQLRIAPPTSGFHCKGSTCHCEGKADCKDLANSGFCDGELHCGSEHRLPPDQCDCIF
jgi:hypothetical protein